MYKRQEDGRPAFYGSFEKKLFQKKLSKTFGGYDKDVYKRQGKDRASVELNCYIESLTVRLYQIHKELLFQEALVIPKHLLVKLFSNCLLYTSYGSLSRAVPSAYGCNCVVKVYNDVAQAFEIYKA